MSYKTILKIAVARATTVLVVVLLAFAAVVLAGTPRPGPTTASQPAAAQSGTQRR